MTRFVTLPLAAVAAGSAIYAYKYEKAMMKVAGINRQSAQDMRVYRREMDKLSASTGKGPAELAEALYFVTSTGFEGAKAMKILDMSAKGAAVGLGETQIIADNLTTVLSAYAGTGLDAARAMDILISAIRVGKAEPAEFASRIGDIASNAAHLGVEFDDIAAGIALMTSKGINTSMSVTALNNLLLGLTKGTKAGAEYLDSVGSSYFKLREVFRTQGLVPGLKEIQRLADLSGPKKTDEVLKTMIPNIRSIRAVWGILGGSGKRLKEVFEAVDKSAGEAQGTFEIWAKTDVGRLQMAWAKFLVGVKNLGVVLLPTITNIIDGISRLADRFSALTPKQKEFLVKWAVIAAIVGPLVWVFGSIVHAVGTLGIAFAKTNLAMKGFGATYMAIKSAFAGGAVFAPQRLAPVAAGATAATTVAASSGAAGGVAAGTLSAAGQRGAALINAGAAASTAMAASTGTATVQLSRTARTLNTVSRAAGGARAGFAAIGASALGIIGPLGIATLAIAGVAAAAYGVYKLSKHEDKIGRRQEVLEPKIITDLRSPDHDELQDYWRRNLGGTWTVRAGELVWAPVKVNVSEDVKPEIEKGIYEIAAAMAEADKETARRTIRGNEARQLDIAKEMEALEPQIQGALMAAQKAGVIDPQLPDVAPGLNRQYETLKREYDRIGALIKTQQDKIAGLTGEYTGPAAIKEIGSKRGEIKKWQSELKNLAGQPQTAEVLIESSTARQKIAELRAEIAGINEDYRPAILEVRVDKSQKRVTKLKGVIEEMKKAGAKPAEIKLVQTELDKEEKKLARLRRETEKSHKVEIKATSKGVDRVIRKIGNVDKALGITNERKLEVKAEAFKLPTILDTLKDMGLEMENLDGQTAKPSVLSDGMTPALTMLGGILSQWSSLAGKEAIHKYVTVHYNATGSTAEPSALGGIVVGPQVRLVGEAGPEAIIPLTNPTRAAEVLSQAGYVMPDEIAGGTQVNYNVQLSLPQGTVVSDIDRFGRSISPYIERATLLSNRRHRRGRVRLS